MKKFKFLSVFSSLALCCALSMGIVIANAATPANADGPIDKTTALTDLTKEDFFGNYKFADNYNHLTFKDKSELRGRAMRKDDVTPAPILSKSNGGSCTFDQLLKGTGKPFKYDWATAPFVDNLNIHIDFNHDVNLVGFECLEADWAVRNYDGKGTWYEVYTSEKENGPWKKAVDKTEMKKLFGYEMNFFNEVVTAKHFKIFCDVNQMQNFNLFVIPSDDESLNAMETEIDHLIACAKAVKGDNKGEVRQSDIDKAVEMKNGVSALTGLEKAQKLVNIAGFLKGSVLKEVSNELKDLTSYARNVLNKAVVGTEMFTYEQARYDEYKGHVENAEKAISKTLARTGDIDSETTYFKVETRLFEKDYKNATITSDILFKKSPYAQEMNLYNLIDGGDARLQILPEDCWKTNDDHTKNHYIEFRYDKEYTFDFLQIKQWFMNATLQMDYIGVYYEQGGKWLPADLEGKNVNPHWWNGRYYGAILNLNDSAEVWDYYFKEKTTASAFRFYLMADKKLEGNNGNNKTIEEIYIRRASDVDEYSLSLGDDLTMNYYATVESGKPSMKFMYENKEAVVDGELVSGTTNRYKFSYKGITPDHLGEQVVGHLMVDGKYQGGAVSHSAEDYCRAQYNNKGLDPKLRKLIDDLLVYGGAAQHYTGYMEHRPANNQITGSTFTNVDKTDKEVSESTSKDVYFNNVGLVLSNKIYLYFNFVKPVDATNVTVKMDGSNVNFVDNGNGTYAVYTTGLKATEMDKVFTVELCVDGKTVQTVKYSAKSYVHYAQNLTGQDNLVNLVKAMYNYGLSAKAYVGK